MDVGDKSLIDAFALGRTKDQNSTDSFGNKHGGLVDVDDFQSHLTSQSSQNTTEAQTLMDLAPPPLQVGGVSMLNGVLGAQLIGAAEETTFDEADTLSSENLDNQIRDFLKQTTAEYRTASGAYEDTQERDTSITRNPLPFGIG